MLTQMINSATLITAQAQLQYLQIARNQQQFIRQVIRVRYTQNSCVNSSPFKVRPIKYGIR